MMKITDDTLLYDTHPWVSVYLHEIKYDVKKQIKSALKLQELVKERIGLLINYMPPTETWNHTEMLEEFQSLLEKSEDNSYITKYESDNT